MAGAAAPHFGALLRRWRIAAGLTQEELAERAGLSSDAVAALERGRRRAPRRGTVALLADGLGVGASGLAALEEAVGPRVSGSDERAADAGQLPIAPTRLIGRDREVRQIRTLLVRAQPKVRLLTLTGPGGVGKTRLALTAVAPMVTAYPDGVVLVELASVREPDVLPGALARALGLREDGGVSPHEMLLQHLRERAVLLLLDNFEHLLEARPLLGELVDTCPRLQVLVTSRAALRLPVEYLLPVEPLAIPDMAVDMSHVEALASVPSIELFVERARAVHRVFRLDQRNAVAVAEVCRRLDGLPLAIELAASRTAVLPPDALLVRLGQQLDVASSTLGDLPRRQQTLSATIDWSYQLLSAQARTTFGNLSIFEGGGTFEAAQRVLDAPIDVLMGLADSSLIVISAPEGDARFGFLETIRTYASQRLPSGAELGSLRARHAGFMLEFCANAERQLTGPEYTEQDRWIHRLQRDHANIRAALRYTIDRGDMNRAAEALWCIHGYLWSNGYGRELEQWSRELQRDQGSLAPAGRARVCYTAGLAAQMRGDLPGAEELLLQALGLARSLEDRRVIGLCLLLLAYSALPREGTRRAIEMLHESAAQFRLAGDAWGEAFTVGGLGELALLENDLEPAEQQFEDYVNRCRARGDVRGLGQALQVLGHVHQLRGSVATAERLLREALPLCRRTNTLDRLALCLRGLACIALERQRLTDAARLVGAADGLIVAATWVSRQPLHVQAAERVRMLLGDAAFDRARAEGRAHPLDELLATRTPDLVSV